MNARTRLASYAGGATLALTAAALAGAPSASATTYRTSSIVKCVYPSGAYTSVQWQIEDTSQYRRASVIAYNENLGTGAQVSGSYIDSISVAELNGGGTYGTGYTQTPGFTLAHGTILTTTAQIPWVLDTTPLTIHWHLRRASNHEECVYNHAM